MKAYKLTNKYSQTRNGTQWRPNVSHSATGDSKKLCSDGWIHFYTDPLIAVLMNPVHANFLSLKLWECETSGKELHESLKSGCKTLTTIREIPLPEITLTQKIAFAILCVKEVCPDKSWNEWADKWLSGEDRSKAAAYAAANAAAAYVAYAYDAANAAYAYAAYAYDAAYAYAAAANAAAANAAAANAAANAAADAAYAAYAEKINFPSIAQKALTYK